VGGGQSAGGRSLSNPRSAIRDPQSAIRNPTVGGGRLFFSFSAFQLFSFSAFQRLP
jgi:hypothetical protein